MTYLEIIHGISEKIHEELKGLREEEYHPSRSSDEMDSYISHQRKRVANLVEIRSHLECLAVGYPEKQ